MATYQTLLGKLFMGDTYIENPQFVDYGDGEGLQISGGNVFKLDGTPVGHCDQPGPRGVQGAVGKTKKDRVCTHRGCSTVVTFGSVCHTHRK